MTEDQIKSLTAEQASREISRLTSEAYAAIAQAEAIADVHELNFEFDLEIIDSPPVEIAGHPEPYLTVVGTIPASPDPITMESSSALLLRVEGQWDAPSSFETV